MDPLTLFATATAAFNGIKKVVAVGREVQDVYKQLGKWADAAGQLHDYINNQNVKKGKKAGKQKSDTAEAFDMITAKARLIKMEQDIKDMFYYGELQDLGEAGYRDFIAMRRQIKEKRENEIKAAAKKRRELIEAVFWSIFAITIVGFIAGIISILVIANQ